MEILVDVLVARLLKTDQSWQLVIEHLHDRSCTDSPFVFTAVSGFSDIEAHDLQLIWSEIMSVILDLGRFFARSKEEQTKRNQINDVSSHGC
jgi:hypothetical protein